MYTFKAHEEESARAASECWLAQMMRVGSVGMQHDRLRPRELCTPGEWYVYFKTGRIEALLDDADTTGWTLAWPERVPTNFTREQMIRYFADRTGKLPYLPVGKFHPGPGR